MHKIDYEKFFKTHKKEDFENEYLDIFRDKRCKKNDKFLQTYEDYNENYKKLKNDNDLEKLPIELKDIFIASYKDLVDWFVDYNDCLKSNKIATIFEVKTKDDSKNKENDKKELSDIYGKFSEKIRSFFAKYADSLNLHSCAYCEAAYTGAWKDDESQNENNRGFFALDHFFPKADYPLFALCLYNFVPSCNSCNTGVKGSNFFNIDFSDVNQAKEKLLHLSPVSKHYDFAESVYIRYIPKLEKIEMETKCNSSNGIKYKPWHYSPLSQSTSENYEVFFDTDFSNATNSNKPNQAIISAMKLNERYNSMSIKNSGLYLLDLKKRYPEAHIQMLSALLAKCVSPEEIENAIFHKDDKNVLLKKLRDDLLG